MKAFPVDSDITEQKGLINEALEKVIWSGRWNGTQDTLHITLSNNALTLPRNWETVLGIRVGGYVRDLAGPWFGYIQGCSDPANWSMNIQDQGDNFCTFAQPSAPAQLRVTSTGSTASCEIHGFDEDNKEIWTTTQRGITCNIGDLATGAEFSRISEVILPITTQKKKLWAIYGGDDPGKELMGEYEPGETVAQYRQYLVPEAVDNDNLPGIVARCQRRHIDLVADNDICPISNIGAIKRAIASIHWDNEGDEKRSEKHFDNCIQMLNDELRRMHPPTEVAAMRVNARDCVASGIYSFR